MEWSFDTCTPLALVTCSHANNYFPVCNNFEREYWETEGVEIIGD
jgi:hypothetical protein